MIKQTNSILRKPWAFRCLTYESCMLQMFAVEIGCEGETLSEWYDPMIPTPELAHFEQKNESQQVKVKPHGMFPVRSITLHIKEKHNQFCAVETSMKCFPSELLLSLCCLPVTAQWFHLKVSRQEVKYGSRLSENVVNRCKTKISILVLS